MCDDMLSRRIEAVRHQKPFGRLRPEARPLIVGDTANEDIEVFSLFLKNHRQSFGCTIRPAPIAIGIVTVFVRTGLDDTI